MEWVSISKQKGGIANHLLRIGLARLCKDKPSNLDSLIHKRPIIWVILSYLIYLLWLYDVTFVALQFFLFTSLINIYMISICQCPMPMKSFNWHLKKRNLILTGGRNIFIQYFILADMFELLDDDCYTRHSPFLIFTTWHQWWPPLCQFIYVLFPIIYYFQSRASFFVEGDLLSVWATSWGDRAKWWARVFLRGSVLSRETKETDERENQRDGCLS